MSDTKTHTDMKDLSWQWTINPLTPTLAVWVQL